MADWKPPTFEGEIKNYTPTLRDRITYGISGLMSGKGELGPDRESMTRARMIANALEYTPLGVATAADDVTRATGRGDYLGAGTTLAMAGMPGPAPKGIKAYHGSPHSFDKFDVSKIGTGEGAQAYGHGIYLAETEDVAKSYKTAGPAGAKLYDGINKRLSEISKEMDKISTGYRQWRDPEKGKALAAEYDDLMEKKLNNGKGLGHMYEVQINADPDQFLDWDKPLSEQPKKVRKALIRDVPKDVNAARHFGYDLNEFQALPPEKQADLIARSPMPKPFESNRGSVMYEDLVKTTGDRSKVTEHLKSKGIPGIKYLDQGSRGKGDGSRNYVVFDDKLIDIRRKYALIAALLGGGGLAAATNTGEAQAGTLQPQGGGGW